MFEGDDQIEGSAGNLTDARGDHIRGILSGRDSDRSFVRMRRKILNDARVDFSEDLVNRHNRIDLLIVAVAAGMIVRPKDALGVLVVPDVARVVRIGMSRMKK